MLLQADFTKLIQELKNEIKTYISHHPVVCKTKDDRTPVTELDYFISNWFKNRKEIEGINFFSEEDHSNLTFPCFILDPVDGTKEYIENRPEWSVTGAFALSADFKNSPYQAFVLNPLSNFLTTVGLPAKLNKEETVMVSRTEWDQGYYSQDKWPFKILPCGSIAYKLGLLNEGKIRAVISRKPKNIWDIAAGTSLLVANGYRFYSAGKKIEKFEKVLLTPPLIWCKPEDEAIFLT
jgi:myo-inositol-1(or 4)-monophosphatase